VLVRDSYLAPFAAGILSCETFAGRDSRIMGCEKGFTHQRGDGFVQQGIIHEPATTYYAT
jgi:hypothetical protein